MPRSGACCAADRRRATSLSTSRQELFARSACSVGERYPHGPLATAAWALRDNVTYYDALYVALAARLGYPLLTADARLARAPGLPCAVELID